MTREEQINILIEARDRALKQIDLTEGHEMGTEDFGRLLYAIQSLEWMSYGGNPVPEPAFTAPAVSVEVQPEEPEPEPVSEKVQSKYSMTDVRAALSKARSKGINVADIIRSFGVENFQQIDASKYPAIMEKLEVATNAT